MGYCSASDAARESFLLAVQREARAPGGSRQKSRAPSVGRVPSGTTVPRDKQASNALGMSHNQEVLGNLVRHSRPGR